jgi:hypothetical protein
MVVPRDQFNIGICKWQRIPKIVITSSTCFQKDTIFYIKKHIFSKKFFKIKFKKTFTIFLII